MRPSRVERLRTLRSHDRAGRCERSWQPAENAGGCRDLWRRSSERYLSCTGRRDPTGQCLKGRNKRLRAVDDPERSGPRGPTRSARGGRRPVRQRQVHAALARRRARCASSGDIFIDGQNITRKEDGLADLRGTKVGLLICVGQGPRGSRLPQSAQSPQRSSRRRDQDWTIDFHDSRRRAASAGQLVERQSRATGLHTSLTWSTALQGVGTGLLVTLLFALPPLLEIRHVKPILVLRRIAAAPPTRAESARSTLARLSKVVRETDWLRLGACVLLGVGILALASWQAGNYRGATVFLAGLAATATVIASQVPGSQVPGSRSG
jgi:hypothetical protein